MGRFPVRTEADAALNRNAPQNVVEGRFPKQGAEHDERQVVHPQGGVEARGVERAFAVHRDIAVLPQLFHGDAHAGFGKAQLIDYVNGAHFAHTLAQHQDRFKIIFCGLVDLHGLSGLLPHSLWGIFPTGDVYPLSYVKGYHTFAVDASNSQQVLLN